ncbi:vacuolar protein sorting-associated protein 26 [Pelomyxa schiedti]|nr:vacuolar protein sorting-associated protein 26 [Pelomyxa schiedti]
MASLGSMFFGAPISVDIQLDDDKTRVKAIATADGTPLLPTSKNTVELFRFVGNEDIRGKVVVNLTPKTKKFDFLAIKIEFIGQIELFYDRGNHFDFTSLVCELAHAGTITSQQVYPFVFEKPEKQFESYNGVNCKCRYLLRVSAVRNLLPNVVKEMDLWVINYQKMPEMNSPIKMEVGIEDCLHIEFEYNKSKYHLKDVVIGKVYFLLVRIKIKYMEIILLKRETAGQVPNVYNETSTITKFEIMDGAPVKGETLPVRLFLGHFDLTPTYRNVHNKFSVKYFLNLVLVDEDDRRYFKQQEITLWRRLPKQATAYFVEEEAPDHPAKSTAPVGAEEEPTDTASTQSNTTTPTPTPATTTTTTSSLTPPSLPPTSNA